MANNKVQTNHGVVEIMTVDWFTNYCKKLGLKNPKNMIVRNDGKVCGFVYDDDTIKFNDKTYPATEENIKKINEHPRYKLI